MIITEKKLNRINLAFKIYVITARTLIIAYTILLSLGVFLNLFDVVASKFFILILFTVFYFFLVKPTDILRIVEEE